MSMICAKSKYAIYLNYINAIISILFIINCCLSCSQRTVSPLFPCSKNISSAYGVNCHLSYGEDYNRRYEELHLMKEIGINVVRGGAHFHTLGYQHGHFNPSMMDSIMKSIESASIPMSGNLSLDAFGKSCWEDKESYARYVDYISGRYNKKILYWEVANEVDLAMSFDNSPYKYTEVLKYIYPHFKNNGKKNKVLVSGISSLGMPFIDSLCSYRAFDYFDIMNFHSYNKPEDLPIHFNELRTIMDKYGFSKELWLGECGMHTAPKASTKNELLERANLEKEQAERLPRIYLISFAYGVNKVFWYEIRSVERDAFEREHHFGLLHADLTPKPAYYAYKTLTKMCPDNSTRPRLERRGKIYVATWKKTDGKKVWALWTSKTEERIELNIKGRYRIYNLRGDEIHKEDNIFAITPSIVYFVGAKNVDVINNF